MWINHQNLSWHPFGTQKKFCWHPVKIWCGSQHKKRRTTDYANIWATALKDNTKYCVQRLNDSRLHVVKKVSEYLLINAFHDCEFLAVITAAAGDTYCLQGALSSHPSAPFSGDTHCNFPALSKYVFIESWNATFVCFCRLLSWRCACVTSVFEGT